MSIFDNIDFESGNLSQLTPKTSEKWQAVSTPNSLSRNRYSSFNSPKLPEEPEKKATHRFLKFIYNICKTAEHASKHPTCGQSTDAAKIKSFADTAVALYVELITFPNAKKELRDLVVTDNIQRYAAHNLLFDDLDVLIRGKSELSNEELEQFDASEARVNQAELWQFLRVLKAQYSGLEKTDIDKTQLSDETQELLLELYPFNDTDDEKNEVIDVLDDDEFLQASCPAKIEEAQKYVLDIYEKRNLDFMNFVANLCFAYHIIEQEDYADQPGAKEVKNLTDTALRFYTKLFLEVQVEMPEFVRIDDGRHFLKVHHDLKTDFIATLASLSQNPDAEDIVGLLNYLRDSNFMFIPVDQEAVKWSSVLTVRAKHDDNFKFRSLADPRRSIAWSLMSHLKSVLNNQGVGATPLANFMETKFNDILHAIREQNVAYSWFLNDPLNIIQNILKEAESKTYAKQESSVVDDIKNRLITLFGNSMVEMDDLTTGTRLSQQNQTCRIM